MSRWIKCDRCGTLNVTSELVMSQYQEVRIGNRSPDWDVCGGCATVVRACIEAPNDDTKHVRSIIAVLRDAGVGIVNMGSPAVSVGALVKQRDELAGQRAELETRLTELTSELRENDE